MRFHLDDVTCICESNHNIILVNKIRITISDEYIVLEDEFEEKYIYHTFVHNMYRFACVINEDVFGIRGGVHMLLARFFFSARAKFKQDYEPDSLKYILQSSISIYLSGGEC